MKRTFQHIDVAGKQFMVFANACKLLMAVKYWQAAEEKVARN